jgi:hypothetical protein
LRYNLVLQPEQCKEHLEAFKNQPLDKQQPLPSRNGSYLVTTLTVIVIVISISVIVYLSALLQLCGQGKYDFLTLMCILDYTHDTLFDSVIGTNASVTLLTKEKDRRNRTELWEGSGSA